MLTTDSFQDYDSNIMVKIKFIRSCGAGKKGEIKELPEAIALSSIAYGNAELFEEKEKPKAKAKAKAKKKVARAKPPVDAER
jgi:hypothetical protein|tara:strand:+ start:2202 stop:2447 length:246 start_codon:yes stop_codon:yes gene_type:complete